MNKNISLDIHREIIKTNELTDILHFGIMNFEVSDDQLILKSCKSAIEKILASDFFEIELDENASYLENINTLKALLGIANLYKTSLISFGMTLQFISKIEEEGLYNKKLKIAVKNVINDFLKIYKFINDSDTFRDNQIYDIIFSKMYSSKIKIILKMIDVSLDYYDPDSDYRDDFLAYISALKETCVML